MDGYTDSLLLWAPATWWPRVGQLRRFPLDADTTFAAALAAEAVPVGHTGSVGVSRLGRSILCAAAWAGEGGGAAAAVELTDPFSGGRRRLPLHPDSGVRPGPRVSLYKLAVAGRVRVVPARLPPPAGGAGGAVSQWRAGAGRPADALMAPAVATLESAAAAWLRKAVAAPSSGRAAVHACLVSGGAPGEAAAAVRAWASAVPPALSPAVPGAPVVAVHQRRLRLTDVLALPAAEAALALETLLEPVPTAAGAASLVLLRVEGADLLWAGANALVDTLAHCLATLLDERARAAPERNLLLVVSSADGDAGRLPRALLSRLAASRVAVPAPTAAQRRAFLTAVVSAAGGEAVPPAELAAAADGLSGASGAALAALTADDVRRLAGEARARAAAAATPGASPFARLYGVSEAVARLEELVVWPLAHLPALAAARIPCGKGVLLCGPSGCGKTALLAVLRERLHTHPGTAAVHVIARDGLALIDKEVGRSEKNIAALFAAARGLAPCVVFLDNLDALAPPRGRTSAETTTATDRTLSALLTEMDGVAGDPSRVVVVIASAPSPAALDAAVCRPGRLDAHVLLRLPPPAASAAALAGRVGQFAARAARTYGLSAAAAQRCRDVVAAESEALLAAADAAAPPSPAVVLSAAREVMLLVAGRLPETAEGSPQPPDLPALLQDAFRSVALV